MKKVEKKWENPEEIWDEYGFVGYLTWMGLSKAHPEGWWHGTASCAEMCPSVATVTREDAIALMTEKRNQTAENVRGKDWRSKMGRISA